MAGENAQRPWTMKIEGPDVELLAGRRTTHWENFFSLEDAVEHAGNLPSYSTAILIGGPGGKRIAGADQIKKLWIRYRRKK
jgi:hypothetical protein